jgi:hypothetical protein
MWSAASPAPPCQFSLSPYTLHRIGAPEGFAAAVPFAQGFFWLEAALGNDRAGGLGGFLGALPFGVEHVIQVRLGGRAGSTEARLPPVRAIAMASR